jgi:hypothetical protein
VIVAITDEAYPGEATIATSSYRLQHPNAYVLQCLAAYL